MRRPIQTLAFVLVAIAGVTFLTTTVFAATPEIETDKESYAPNEAINVVFRNSPGNSNDWITLVPQATPDGRYQEWKWIGTTEGTVSFRGVKEGIYEVRIHLKGTHNEPAARHVLTVGSAAAAARQSGADAGVGTALQGDPTGVGSGQEPMPPGATLRGGDAYAALLDLYIHRHPDAARHPEFLPYFAGLGCLADGWGRTQHLNPFEVTEIESAAKPRLAHKLAEASASSVNEPLLITFRANITAGDYDMAEGVFPVTAGRSIEGRIRPDDFCPSVARAKDLRHRSVFPVDFQIAVADGKSLEPSHVVDMLGGKVAIGRERARAFYERGFPTIVVEVTGRVRSVTRATAGVGFVTLEPVRATLRTQGNARYAQELAVLESEQLGSFAAGTAGAAGAPGGTDAMMRFDRDVYLIGFADLASRSPAPRGAAHVYYSTINLDGSEARALTDAIAGAIGAAPALRGPSVGVGDLAGPAIRSEGYALVAGDWHNKIVHALRSYSPNVDFSVTQIARADGGAAPPDETSAPPQALLPAADFGRDEMPILRAWIPQYLENTPQPEQIEVFRGFITQLHQARDYTANAIFGEGEIEGRQAEFLAQSAYDRWLTALEKQSIEPPFNISFFVWARDLEYDFESRELVLFGGRDASWNRVLWSSILRAGGFDQESRLLGIESPYRPGVYPTIRINRNIPTRFRMDAGRVEEMIANRDIVAYDVALRISSVQYEEGNRGEHGLALEAEILGVNVAIVGGEQLTALAAEDIPQTAPEPELQPKPTGTDARELSVAGIELGMPLEEAAAALVDVAETIYHAKVTPADSKLVQDRYTFFVLDNAETFALHTADAASEPVIGVARRIPVGEDVPVDTIRTAFVDKYGVPTLTEESGTRISWRWEPVPNKSVADLSCVAHFSNAMGSGQVPLVAERVKDVDAISRVFDGASMWVQSDDNSFFSYYMKDRAPRIGLAMEDRLRDCAAFLHVDFISSRTHANYIRVYLVDAAAFEVELEAATEEGGAGTLDSKL